MVKRYWVAKLENGGFEVVKEKKNDNMADKYMERVVEKKVIDFDLVPAKNPAEATTKFVAELKEEGKC